MRTFPNLTVSQFQVLFEDVPIHLYNDDGHAFLALGLGRVERAVWASLRAALACVLLSQSRWPARRQYRLSSPSTSVLVIVLLWAEEVKAAPPT